jgi:hypothetical protein
MIINKMGYAHMEKGLNCQDYFFSTDWHFGVLDGCSEGKHSEVGAKLFAKYYKDTVGLPLPYVTYWKVLNAVGVDPEDILDYGSFTILIAAQEGDDFVAKYCGDGYIIAEKIDGTIEIINLEEAPGKPPKYLAYNFVSPKYLKDYKTGVRVEEKRFPTSEYTKIGLASDGIRFALGNNLEQEFIEILKSGNEFKMKLFINRNHSTFKDDVTIIF